MVSINFLESKEEDMEPFYSEETWPPSFPDFRESDEVRPYGG